MESGVRENHLLTPNSTHILHHLSYERYVSSSPREWGCHTMRGRNQRHWKRFTISVNHEIDMLVVLKGQTFLEGMFWFCRTRRTDNHLSLYLHSDKLIAQNHWGNSCFHGVCQLISTKVFCHFVSRVDSSSTLRTRAFITSVTTSFFP